MTDNILFPILDLPSEIRTVVRSTLHPIHRIRVARLCKKLYEEDPPGQILKDNWCTKITTHCKEQRYMIWTMVKEGMHLLPVPSVVQVSEVDRPPFIHLRWYYRYSNAHTEKELELIWSKEGIERRAYDGIMGVDGAGWYTVDDGEELEHPIKTYPTEEEAKSLVPYTEETTPYPIQARVIWQLKSHTHSIRVTQWSVKRAWLTAKQLVSTYNVDHSSDRNSCPPPPPLPTQ